MSNIIVTLRNPLKKDEKLTYYIKPNPSQLAKDWINALKKELSKNSELEVNYLNILREFGRLMNRAFGNHTD